MSYRPPMTEWTFCPYNKAHFITTRKFHAHLDKCRRNDKIHRLQRGIPIDVFACKFCSDLCYGPELIFHESRCMKRNIVRSHQMNFAPLQHLCERPRKIPEVEDMVTDKEIEDVFRGADLGITRGAFIEPFSMKQEIRAAGKSNLEGFGVAEHDGSGNAAGGSGAAKDQSDHPGQDGTEGGGEEDEDEYDSDAYWNNPSKPSPKFDMMENLRRISVFKAQSKISRGYMKK